MKLMVGQRALCSLSVQVSGHPCSLLLSSEPQPLPMGEILTEAKTKVARVSECVCVCGGLYVMCCMHVLCMATVCCTCVHVCMCVACVFTRPKPLPAQAYNTSLHCPTADNLQSLGPAALENGQGSLLPCPNPLLFNCGLSQSSSTALPPKSPKGRRKPGTQQFWLPIPMGTGSRWLGGCA